jgi:pantothenate kinase type III
MSGVTAASLGAVDYMTRSMQRAGCAARCCVVSGGNSRFIEPYLTLEMKVVKNLVLEGLIRIALEKP